MNNVKVFFDNGEYNYITSVSAETTEESATKYFVGKVFNVGSFPTENYQRCVRIEFRGTYRYAYYQPFDSMEWFNEVTGQFYDNEGRKLVSPETYVEREAKARERYYAKYGRERPV